MSVLPSPRFLLILRSITPNMICLLLRNRDEMIFVHLSVYCLWRRKVVDSFYSSITTRKDDTPCPTDVLRSGKSEGEEVVKIIESMQ